MSATARPPEGGASQAPERAQPANRTHPLPREGGWGEGTPLYFGIALLLLGYALASGGAAQAREPPPRSLRGLEITAEEPTSGFFRFERDHLPWPRDYPQQVPLVPHSIKGYALTGNFNRCLDCHAPPRHSEVGAPKVSLSHYLDREGHRLERLSPRHYFCLQCHVPQTDARPLVANSYRAPRAPKAEGK